MAFCLFTWHSLPSLSWKLCRFRSESRCHWYVCDRVLAARTFLEDLQLLYLFPLPFPPLFLSKENRLYLISQDLRKSYSWVFLFYSSWSKEYVFFSFYCSKIYKKLPFQSFLSVQINGIKYIHIAMHRHNALFKIQMPWHTPEFLIVSDCLEAVICLKNCAIGD